MYKPWDYLFLAVHGVVVLVVTVIIIMTRFVSGYEGLLLKTTVENGLFELASVFALVALSVFCCVMLFQNRRQQFFSGFQRVVFVVMALLAMLAAMEEISWGQQFFGFQSGVFFENHNLQKETNLHNLIPAMWLSTAINVVVYGGFIVLPVLYYCDFKGFPLQRLFKRVPATYWPSHFVILVMVYSSSLHHYFAIITWSDTAALLVSVLILMIYWKRRKLGDDLLFSLNLLVLLACSLCYAACYKIFSQYNLQYEIREFVVVYGAFYWMADWGLRLKSDSSPWFVGRH